MPCYAWEGECPSEGPTYTCARGCRTDVTWLEYFHEPREMCEEFRPKQVGDACTDEEECRPEVATVDAALNVTNVYLTCDLASGTCVSRDPPTIPDFMSPCGIAPMVDGEYAVGVLETDLCGGGVCLYEEGARQACFWQGCTARCETDGDCPIGTVCNWNHHYEIDVCDTPDFFASGITCPM